MENLNFKSINPEYQINEDLDIITKESSNNRNEHKIWFFYIQIYYSK